MSDFHDSLRKTLFSRFDKLQAPKIPDHKQMINALMGQLGTTYGSPQGHFGSVFGSLAPQWVRDSPVKSMKPKAMKARAASHARRAMGL